MRWGNGTEAQQFHGSTDDLCLQLVSVGHSQDTAPGVRTNGKHGLCAAANILVCGQFLQLCQPLHSNRPVC